MTVPNNPELGLSKLLFQAREIAEMFADVVEARTTREDTSSRRLVAEIDAFRLSRGWSPSGFGGEDSGLASETIVEYGYRLSDGREVWAEDYGQDGSWTPEDKASGTGSIDLTYATDSVAAIQRALEQSGADAVVICRQVTISRGLPQQIG